MVELRKSGSEDVMAKGADHGPVEHFRRADASIANWKPRGVIALACSWRGLAEEQSDAYKDVNQVVEVFHNANLARKVARMRPIGVVKG